MSRLALLVAAVVLVACAKKEAPPATDTGMAAAPAPAAPAAISLADVAGNWAVQGKYEGKDSVVVKYDLTATADTTGWMIKFPNRAKPVNLRVSVSGDSIITEGGPYESAITKGVQVRTHAVFRMQDGKMVGRTTAHYDMKGPDSLRIIVSEGTRK